MSITWDDTGHVMIGEKAGVVKIMDGWVGQPNRVLLDIQNIVASYGDHGCVPTVAVVTLAVVECPPPSFPPIRVCSLNHVQYFGGYLWAAFMVETAPWGDQCTDFGYIDRPLAEVYGCKVTGRVSRWPYDQATGTITGPEQIVLNGADGDIMCGQFSTHGTTMVIPGPDGFMYIAVRRPLSLLRSFPRNSHQTTAPMAPLSAYVRRPATVRRLRRPTWGRWATTRATTRPSTWAPSGCRTPTS